MGQNNQEDVDVRFDVRSPMRDGVELSADIWRPAANGRYPAILLRTPYTKGSLKDAPDLGAYFARHGYVFILQDVRGRGDSDGQFQELPQEGKDGYDSIEWIAQQPWSDGRVGMMGSSYLGVVQWLAAREKPPHLVCIVPTAAPGFPFEDEPYQGGAFKTGLLQWAFGVFGRSVQLDTSRLDWNWILRHRPMTSLDGLAGHRLFNYQDWLSHPTIDDYWKGVYLDPEDFRKLTIPTLTVTGWFDDVRPGALYSWRGMKSDSSAAAQQFLLIGPWNHRQTFVGGQKRIDGFDVGADSILDMREVTLAFFERFLKGSSELPALPQAKVYITGENRWHTLTEYPPANTRSRILYLHSGGAANASAEGGTLTWEAPRNERSDRYRYDPDDPAPSYQVENSDSPDGGRARKTAGKRQDILIYTTAPLDSPLTMLGQLSLVLYAASDARDTDFIFRVLDVYPDGRILRPYAGDGVIRTRYRNGYDSTMLLVPNRVERYLIKLGDIGHRFLQGHRIRVEVTSSSFPDIFPNTNTGNPIASDLQTKVAVQKILHNRKNASYLDIPVLPDGNYQGSAKR